MFFRQYYLGCLSHASYLIGDETTGRAVVVDPQRDVSEYLADAQKEGLEIERVIETHVHADFVSGHLELASKTGAAISYGEGAELEYPVEHLHDGRRLNLGAVDLEVLATPGHTPESISIVVYENGIGGTPYGVLTGDALFIGDVGRPDLLASAGTTAEELARKLYRSLRTKLLTLPDATKVYPAHGAGSSCGKHLSSETVSTIGEQRMTNYALAPMTEDEFVAVVTEGQPAAPAYFSYDAQRNREMRSVLEEGKPPPVLDIEAVVAMMQEGGVVIDTRPASDFAAGHLRGSINVGLEGRFSEYAGDIAQPSSHIAVVCEPGLELESKVRLARVGFDNVVGCLRDPYQSFVDHPDLVASSSRLTASELAQRREELANIAIIDVRNPGELAGGVIPGSKNLPLATLADGMRELDHACPTVVYCGSGYRSSIAASAMAAAGFADVSDLLGGYEAWTRLEARDGA